MSTKVDLVEAYMTAYAAGDHEAVGTLLTDDVVWVIYGHARLQGRGAFINEMKRGEAAGPPTIRTERFIEGGDVVCATGSVRAPLPDGSFLNLAFSDIFTFRDDLIAQLDAYLVPLAAPPA